MDIGGKDIIFKTPLTLHNNISLVKNLIRHNWPEAIFEDADDCVPDVDFFAYENAAAKEIWSQDVPEEGVRANMIYALFDTGVIEMEQEDAEIDLVCEQDTESETLCEQIKDYFVALRRLVSHPKENDGSHSETT